MTAYIFRKLPQSLRPVSSDGEAWLDKIPLGAEVALEAKRHRSGPQNRKFWKLMDTVHGTLREDVARLYPTTEKMVDAIKVYLGVREELYRPNGEILAVKPGSVAFDKMPQDEFNDFMDRTITLVCKHFLPGVKSEDLRREIEEMVS